MTTTDKGGNQLSFAWQVVIGPSVLFALGTATS